MGSEKSLIQAGIGSASERGRTGLGVAVWVGSRMKVGVSSGVPVGVMVGVGRGKSTSIQAKANRMVKIEKNKNFNCRIFLILKNVLFPAKIRDGFYYRTSSHTV